MQKAIECDLKNCTVIEERLSLASSIVCNTAPELDVLADTLVDSLNEQ